MLSRKFKIFIFVSSLFTLCSCATIHFDNGELEIEQQSSAVDAGLKNYHFWHHQVAFQLAEFSNPPKINRVCAGSQWNRVTTELTFLNATVGLLDNLILLHASSPGLDIWTPWSIEYSCR